MKYLLMTSLSALALTVGGCAMSHHDKQMDTRTISSSEYSSTQANSAMSQNGNVRRTVVIVTDSPLNEADYRSSLAGPGKLAMITSQLAQTKTSNANVMAFANAEVAEQQGISASLKQMGTTIPLLNADQQIILSKLKAAKPGQEFDELYMEGQVVNHKKLLMITENYLDNTSKNTNSTMEAQTRDLANMSLPVIKRHLKTAIELEDMVD